MAAEGYSAVVMNHGPCGFNSFGYQTWYLGSNEQLLRFNKYGHGGWVDDGLFIAIPDGGPYGGYSYFELKHPRQGAIDGGPAHLPPSPGEYPVSGLSLISRSGYSSYYGGPRINPPAGSLTISYRGQIAELPNGADIPIGSRFFFWVSGGGGFGISTEILKSIKSRVLVVKSQALSKPEDAIWFDSSDVNERNFTLIEE